MLCHTAWTGHLSALRTGGSGCRMGFALGLEWTRTRAGHRRASRTRAGGRNCPKPYRRLRSEWRPKAFPMIQDLQRLRQALGKATLARACRRRCRSRSEEHTSELQSRFDLVCRLLLEKKKKKNNT